MDDRAYPTRPFLAASAAVIRDGRVLIVRRGGTFGRGIYTLPGGVVEAGETLTDAVIREVQEETAGCDRAGRAGRLSRNDHARR